MKKLLTLTLFQLKDKIDFSWTKQTKTVIQRIVFGILKFIIVVGITFAFLFLLSFIDLYSKYSDLVPLYTIFFSIVFISSFISSTISLTKSLYFADDNRVLVTLPASTNQLFFSKIMVYLLFELKKSLSVLVPGTLGFLIFGIISYKGQQIAFWPFLWFLIPLLLAVVVQVLLSALFSIPTLYIIKFYRQNAIFGLITLIIAVIAGIVLTIFLITLIPENIDLMNQWPLIRGGFQNFIGSIDRYIYPLNLFSRMIFGEASSTAPTHYIITGLTFIKTAIIIGGAALCVGLIYLLIKPFYFRMISKTFDFDKNMSMVPKKNVVHKKYVTFANKEVKLSFRDFDVSGAYIAIYILVPILLLLMDKVISAISTSLRGNNIALAVNVLLTILPLLASNSMIATMYSKEGRTAYTLKTNPVDPLIPLGSKLLFNLFLSVPSIAACSVIIALYTEATVVQTILFGFTVLLVQYAHIFYSAIQDIMNPQNEAFATSGSDFNNPNETKVTIVAFVGSFAFAIMSYLLFVESQNHYANYYSAFIRIFLIGSFLFAGSLALFILKIKAFYYEK